MEKYTFQIQDEFTYWRIIGFLDENKIEYSCRKIESSLFPSFNHGGEIEVFAQDVPTVEELLRGEEDSPTETNVYKSASQALPTQTTQSGTTWNKWWYWLLGYSLLMTVLFIRYFLIAQVGTKDKNISYEWNATATALYARHTKTKELLQKNYDANYDKNFERIEQFAKGNLIAELKDEDENGFFEKNYQYDQEGRITSVDEDTDQDGLIDKFYMVMQKGDTLFFVDSDKNGIFELVKKK